jgi:hypothetical protein
VWSCTLDESGRYLWGFLPCLNRGWGEEAWRWGGPFDYRARTVQTPGTGTREGWGRAGPGVVDHFRGTSSGEEWIGTEFEHQVVYRHHQDGSFEAWGPGSELLTNLATDQRVVVRFVAHLWVDAGGGLSRRSRCRVTDCRYL